MLNSEQRFQIGALAFLTVVLVAVTAIAENEEAKEEVKDTNVMSTISLLEEAELINSGALSPYNLTQIGSQTESKK